jgi:two-component system NtrC family sensor kinase
MEKHQGRFDFSFSTKVLLPVVAIMVVLIGTIVWTINRRVTQQFQAEAARSLATADSVFRNSQKIRRNNLLLRYHNLPKEPRYKANFQEKDPRTLTDFLQDLLGEQHVDIILFTTEEGEVLASAKRDFIPTSEFEKASSVAIHQALAGDEQVDTIGVGDRLFDVVSVPVRGTSDSLIGALTFGAEIGDGAAQEFSGVTHSQIVLVSGRRVIASTVSHPGAREEFSRVFQECLASTNQPSAPRNLLLGDEHFYCSAGNFPSLSGDERMGYLLLSSYDQALQALRATQQRVLLASAGAILLGIGIVWFLIRSVTRPLRELRDTAEAVGRGDFSRRVEVMSRDECGELAAVFNQMTENLKTSREQLEMTVETLKTTQAQLIQSEKLSGIGEFVAGVAHELNNPLTSVMGFSELLKRADSDPQHQRYLDMIHKSSLRCQKIVQSLLSFARRHQPERKMSSVNELVEGVVEILQYQLRTNNIEVKTNLDPNLPRAMVDPHQVQQVFLNIVNNARQAIESNRSNGWVRIATETRGRNVRVVFQDNGPGIAEENLSKVFDPFFTTKEVGKGTGLGLSLCYGIIKEHGGTITIHSKLGQGAMFVVELPLAGIEDDEPAEPEAAAAKTVNRLPNRREGVGKKVLVIDDEDAILQMVREALSEHGYEVDVARDGESALRRLGQTPYDLALCDWKMPGLNGQQVYERLRVSNPGLSERMIFITGDVINDKTQKFLHDCKKVCLSKPFSLEEFRDAIGKALAVS